MFAYCKNNPVILSDPSGYGPELGLIFAGPEGWLVLGVITLGVAITTLPKTSSVDTVSSATRASIQEYMDSITVADKVANSFRKVKKKPNYRTPTEIHHIVAENAPLAQPARDILSIVKIDINDPRNLVDIKTGLHRRLHSNVYYWTVNVVVQSAYDPSMSLAENQKSVFSALDKLRAGLKVLDALSPF